jgi:hypothetical protein
LQGRAHMRHLACNIAGAKSLQVSLLARTNPSVGYSFCFCRRSQTLLANSLIAKKGPVSRAAMSLGTARKTIMEGEPGSPLGKGER